MARSTAAEIRALGRRALVVRANVGDLDDLAQLFNTIGETFGGLDYYIHNAASGYNRPVLAQKPRGWEWTMNINARSLLFGAQHAARLMTGRDGSAIVAISSLGSVRVLPDYAVVGASKAALETLVRYLGVELAPHNITVNAVSPGLVLTDALQNFAIFREEEQALQTELENAQKKIDELVQLYAPKPNAKFDTMKGEFIHPAKGKRIWFDPTPETKEWTELIILSLLPWKFMWPTRIITG